MTTLPKERIDFNGRSQFEPICDATLFLLALRYDDAKSVETAIWWLTEMPELRRALWHGPFKSALNSPGGDLLLRLGDHKFASPNVQAAKALDAIADVGRLDDLFVRLLDADSWQEFLAA